MKEGVSCIIPAHNEGERIGNVLKAVLGNPSVREVIVINDGSTDKTREIVKKFKRVKLINNKINQGKSKSVMYGIERAEGPLLLMLDADLLNINKENITALIAPVQKELADISISLRKNAPWHFKLIGLDFLSGERVFSKELVKDFKKLEKIPGWGIESGYLNKIIIKNNLRLKVVHWDNVESPYPQKKLGYLKGNVRFMKQIFTILSITGLFGTTYQIFKMISLKV